MDYSRIKLQDIAENRPDIVAEIRDRMEARKGMTEDRTKLLSGRTWKDFQKVTTKSRKESAKGVVTLAIAKQRFLNAVKG